MISHALENWFFRAVAPRSVRHVQPISHRRARGLVRAVYDQMARDFQVVPPFTLHSSNGEILAASWMIFRESALAGPVSRVNREAVAVAVSKCNQCPFCIDAHTMMLHGGHAHAIVQRLLGASFDADEPMQMGERAQTSGEAKTGGQAQTDSLIRWALAIGAPQDSAAGSAPCSSAEAPFLIGTAVAFQFINRMCSVFLADSPMLLPAALKPWRGMFVRASGAWIGRRIMGLYVEAGDSLPLLPEGPALAEFHWAERDAAVGGAFRRFCSVMEKIETTSIAPSVREVVQRQLANWEGSVPGLSRGQIDSVTADLPAADQAAARLALLTAVAANQVDESAVREFRRHLPADETLVATAAWGSYLATKRIAGWLAARPCAV